LTQAEVEERLNLFGRNTLQEVKGKSLYLKFLANFTHLMAILLWVGGGVAFVAQMPQLGVAVWMVNVINGAFSFWQEYRAEKATEALKRLLPSYARVLREGEEARVLAEGLVPGDVILLAEGDSLSADARLVQESQLRLDQSTLTGESRLVRKSSDPVQAENLSRSEMPNLVFAGTTIASGTGKALVYATGMNTQFGKIAHLTQSVGDDLSPLQKEMITVTKVVTIFALVIGAAFFVLAATLARITLAESFIFALGMIVAFVPEGLLPTVTLALAMGTQRMAHRHALIKKLSAVETLGCTTVICTDKTGTLTQNEMTVRDVWLGGWRLAVTGVGYAPEGQLLVKDEGSPRSQSGSISSYPDQDLRQFLLAAALCNNARLLPPNGASSAQSDLQTRWGILGDPTEAALKVVAIKAGLDLNAEEARLPRWRELPFESRRKRMSTIHLIGDKGRITKGSNVRPSSFVVYAKGAPKEILDLCTCIRLNGQDLPIDDNWRAQIMAANDDYARSGLRVLAVAERRLSNLNEPIPVGEAAFTSEKIERDLTFLGLAAMMDPPRPEVSEAVEKCHRAGIRVVMMTGDYGLTAESIARKIGIVRGEQPRLVTGVELDAMNDLALKEALAGEVIFARVAPENKLRVVSILQELGNVVAVTGDGVNDSPALKKADIGVAMGLTGTDVAKEAADMILTDDNFASIVNAVEEGRSVYANIKKFTTYIFTSNAPEAVPFILFALSGARIPLALNVMHVLSIDLGTDIVPALALGAELPEPGVMDRPPRNLKEHVITRPLLLRAYFWLGLVEGAAAMAAFYFMYWTNGYWGRWIDLPASGPLYQAATAMALAAVVTSQIGNLFAQRSERVSAFRIPLLNNRMLWAGIATELGLVLLIVYVPLFQNFIGVSAFPLKNWLFLFAWAPVLLLVDEALKLWLRWREANHRGGKTS
jgi:magnesium-transporting ATPase (P-type)